MTQRHPEPKPGEGIKKHVAADGTVTYWVRVARTGPDGKRVHLRASHPTLTAARAWRVSALAAAEPPAPRAAVPTVAEALEAHVTRKTASVRAETARGYRAASARVAADRIGSLRADRLTRDDVEGFAQRLATTGAMHTVKATLTLLRVSLQVLVEDGLLRWNPATRVVPRGRPQQQAQSFSADERAALEAAVTAHRNAPLWRFVLMGLRRSECMALTWDDLDLAAGTVTIRASRTATTGGTETNRTKTRRGTRTLPLTEQHQAELALLAERYRVLFGPDHERLLWLSPTGTPLHPGSTWRAWRALCETAGVRPLPLKAARSTSVTAMREAGVPLQVVASWHGHTEVMSANTYTAVDVVALTQAVGWGR